jgi:hypothetical protein
MTISRQRTPVEVSFTRLLTILDRSRPNVLLIGDTITSSDVLEHMRPHLLTPLVSWLPRESSVVPTRPFRTLVVQDVDQLAPAQQADLLALLDDAGADVQLVSLAREPLFPAVVNGTFFEDLYYRLNVVVFDCAAAQPLV